MAIGPMSEFLQNLRRATLRRDEAGLTDGQLLDAYVRDREEAALAALVRRHGPMVWGVCRRVLGNDHDAEDAFQAAFLVLVRKAASIVPREKVANFLYGVARQTAGKARAMGVRRKAREKQVEDMPESATREPDEGHDLLPLLDQELSRLPDKYRIAIVLCDLEGKTYKEAARQLGCPEGTLSARLARGRTMLAKRLSRHGLAVTGGMLAAFLSREAAACVPPSVVSSTIKAATLFAAGPAAATGVISVKVAALTEGMLKTMLLTKLKMATAMLLMVAAVAVGGLAYQTRAEEQAPKTKVAAAERAKTSENILQNAGFEKGAKSPAHWSQGAKIDGVQYIWDKENGQQGKASVCLHKTAQRYFPIAQWYQIVDRKGDKSALRVAAQVKAEGVTKAIIDVIFLDEKEETIGHHWASYIGAKEAKDPPANHDWKEYAGQVEIPKEAKKIQVGLQIYGPGKVWFDEVRAEYTK
jgi:RNA polymerase sigma factor (sigma-70 family)